MATSDSADNELERQYADNLAGEGEFWDSYIATRILQHDEIPGSVDFRLFFTQYSRKHNWGPPCLGPIAINFREREIRYVLSEATRVPGARVLDLWCGAGWLSLELARQGAHVTALDVSHTNVALGRHMAATNARNFPFLYQMFAGLPCALQQFGSIEYIYADLNSVELPKNAYDAVVVWDSLHHVRDLERLLEQVRSALKSDGVFVGVDHAFATPLTIAYNEAVAPWLQDLSRWLTDANPEWLYREANGMACQYDWGVLDVDYDAQPIPGFEAFEAEIKAEMLSIIRSGLKHERLATFEVEPHAKEAVSPFEDVSADHLMRALLETFRVERFQTICPLITPEQYFAPPRSEPERIFQHYLAALLVELNEQAIREMRADGQWFLFHLAPQPPSPGELPEHLSPLMSSVSAESIAYALERSQSELAETSQRVTTLEGELAALKSAFESSTAYVSHVEAEVARKNAAISDLESRVRSLERELGRARTPRFPRKKRPD